MVKKGLGKGLSALIKEDVITSVNSTNLDENKVIQVDINKIQPDENQPRKQFNQENLEELANSIKSVGIINPIIVRQKGEFYEIISGERRWRACRIAGIRKIPIIIREYSELERVEISLIENIQRQDLNPIEEALTFKRLQDEFNLSHEEISEKVGKNRTTITNSLRLLKLDDKVQDLLINQQISTGNVRPLLALKDKDKQFELAKKIIAEQLSVRQTETLVKSLLENQKQEQINNQKVKNVIYENIKKELNQLLGTKVDIKAGKNKGKIEIEYYSEEELDRIVCLFKNKL